MKKIKVHEKVLAHLSRGLYRSPASALRELVSNAWDANATNIRINTSYPKFFQLSVEDNGDGFSSEEFEDLMEGGIGNSQKRPSNKKLINDRPLIGRLGIGMLGIAQICGGFTLTSYPKTGKAFKATVKLFDLLKERLDSEDETVIHEEETKLTEVNVGEYELKELGVSKEKSGTTIISDEVHPTFIRAFQKSLTFEKYKDPPLEWEKALKIVSKIHSLQELGDYWRLLWELAASCPVPYASSNALPNRLVTKEQQRLQSYKFKVIVDGIELLKPILLRGNPGGYTTRKIEPQARKIYGREVEFHGYIAVQEGMQLKPDELRGIMIRIKNIGIGYYDPSLLDYRFNEGPRSRWVTGEIFVDQGLEDALNIDRDSFNRFHPEYKAVQEFVHTLLRDEIFPDVYKQIDKRSVAKAKVREQTRNYELRKVIEKEVEAPVAIRKSRESDEIEPVVAVKKKQDTVEISIPSANTIKTKKSNQQLASAILAIFEVAMRERDRDRQKEVFRRLLLDLLARW